MANREQDKAREKEITKELENQNLETEKRNELLKEQEEIQKRLAQNAKEKYQES